VVLAPPLVSVVFRLLGRSLRIRLDGATSLFDRWQRGEQVIVAFWHDRLLVMPLLARAPVCILVSQHRDGEIATRALRTWGIHTVRGSATRGAVVGFLRLLDAYRRGDNLAVIPDGPRGPRHRVKPGVIRLAKRTGAAIVPVTYAASPAVRLRSWDRLIVPLPFARVEVLCGEPITVPPQVRRDELESHRRVLEQRLNELTREAESRLAA
jgi:lysophospholipid acyltransferase (LPLAT)-like uncharacterized protein